MFNPFSLENKVVVISGAASGIARQCAISCSKMGAKLILLDLNEEGLDRFSLATVIHKYGQNECV